MTQVIVPLAGPDIYSPDIKPLRDVDGISLIARALGSRPWIRNFNNEQDQLTFILRDDDDSCQELTDALNTLFPMGTFVRIPELTQGASFSAMAGLAMNRNVNRPVIIDLADIGFSTTLNPAEYFKDNPEVVALAPYFTVNEQTLSKERYSYLELEDNAVVSAREKEIISDHASAGVYLFRNVVTFLKAMQYALENPDISAIAGVYFVCPMVNGLTAYGEAVHGVAVTDAVSYSA